MATLPKGWDWTHLAEWLKKLKGLGKIIAVEEAGESTPATGSIALKFGKDGAVASLVVKAATADEKFVLTVPVAGKPSIEIIPGDVMPCSFRLKEGIVFGFDGITAWLKYVAKGKTVCGTPFIIAFRAETKVGIGDLV